MRPTRLLSPLVLASLLVLAGAGADSAHAQPVSPHVKRKLDQLDRHFAKLQMNAQWERGNISPGEVGAAKRHQREFLRTLNRATREFNRLPPRHRSQELRNRIARFGRYHTALSNALQGRKAAAPGTGGTLSSRTQRTLRDFERLFGKIQLDAQLCAGNTQGRQQEARRLAGRIYSAMSFGKYKLAAISAAERTHPQVAPWVKRIEAAKACQAAIAASDAKAKADIKDVGKRRRAFFAAAGAYTRDMRAIVPLLRHPNQGSRYLTVQQVQSRKAALDAVHAMCTGDYKYAVTDPPEKYTVADDRRPHKWCEAAAKRQQLLVQLINNSVPLRMADTINNLKSLTAKIEGDKGFRSGEGITSPFGEARYLGKKSGGIAAMYQAIGATPPSNIRQQIADAYKGYWAEVKRVAGATRPPRAKGHHGYAERAAKKRLKRDGNVNIMRSGLLRSSGAWKIQRNALGVVLSRSHSGFVLYKLKGESICRVGYFTYKESASKRRFVKPPGVGFPRMQFTRCR